jgi:hypothetical protein
VDARRGASTELAVTLESVQSSISKLTVAHPDISFAIRNSTACIDICHPAEEIDIRAT